MITGAEIISSIANRAQLFAAECAHKFPTCTEIEVKKGVMSALLLIEEFARLGRAALPDDVLSEIVDVVGIEDDEWDNVHEVGMTVIKLIPTKGSAAARDT